VAVRETTCNALSTTRTGKPLKGSKLSHNMLWSEVMRWQDRCDRNRRTPNATKMLRDVCSFGCGGKSYPSHCADKLSFMQALAI
jgi:hypothetical protein